MLKKLKKVIPIEAQNMTTQGTGVLLTNIGSPDEPTTHSVHSYLEEFLSDPRVVEIPRLLWWPILHGIILPTRSVSSAKLYQKIWTDKGSPLLYYCTQLTEKLQQQLQLPIVIGMNYGNPSIQSALDNLKKLHINKILVLPLFPQYSATTIAASFDKIMEVLKSWRVVPEMRTIHSYATNENYIDAICHSIKQHSLDYLLFSYHGIPKQCIENGDPYAEQCSETTRLIVKKLALSNDQWSLAFQSRIGRSEWLQPYTKDVLKKLPKKNIKNIHVICPGFSVDCLETLEEIAIRGKETFLQSGGKTFNYIPALNDSEEHIKVLKELIKNNILEW